MAKITIIIKDFEFPSMRLVDCGKPEPVMYTKDNLPNEGERVLVRDSNEELWEKAHFQRYESAVPYPWHTRTDVWAQCAKYDERLLS